MHLQDVIRPFVPRFLINELYHRSRAMLAALRAGFPSRKLVLIGVTGTDGKTSTTNFIHSILMHAGKRAGMVSTIAVTIGDTSYDTGLHTTTPDPKELQAFLAKMVERGMTHAVVEVTSHGLAQHRLWGSAFDVAVVTNVTREHLDYHGTYENYLRAKSRLFRMLASKRKGVPPRSAGYKGTLSVPKVAVLNRDDESFEAFTELSQAADKRLTYSVHKNADFVAENITVTETGTRFVAHTPKGDFSVHLPLIGSFFAANALAAIAATWHLDIATEAMIGGLASVHSLPGRMQRVRRGQPFTVFIDFAHTPASLKALLRTLRSLTRNGGRVIVVFGCAGLRDREKRGAMGRVSGELADFSVFTAEDPRTEDLSSILAAMEKGATEAGRTEDVHYRKIPDRREAIAYALQMAEAPDTVVVTGKGHEQSMCIGKREYPWDDQRVVQEELGKLGYKKM